MTTPNAVTLRTERLLLRPWRSSDRAPFAALRFGFEQLHLEEIVSFTSVGTGNRAA